MPTHSARSALFALAASVTLAGCAVGPNYERPKLPTPPEYRFVAAPAQAQSLADAPWFQVFDDPALQALIRDAIANNLDMRVALAHVEEARARAGIAKSYLYPQVDGTAAYGLRGASTTQKAIDGLVKQEIVTRDAGFVRIAEPFYAEWIRRVGTGQSD